MKFVILGAPRTKKNHGERWRPKGSNHILTVPSKAWREWARNATIVSTEAGLASIRFVALNLDGCFFDTVFPDEALNCAAVFYRDARRGDAVGYYQGLADLLEKRGVVADDAQIAQWDGSRMTLDSKNPRVELELTPL